MPSYKSIPSAPFIRGTNAATDPYSQPKGTVPRMSNFVLRRRGALHTVDGSGIVDAFQGQIQTGRGRFMAIFLYEPSGVAPYYMALAATIQGAFPLGAPLNLTASATGSGGTLASGTYFYLVTALDGAGGETLASNEVSVTLTSSQNALLTWNTVPNAFAYNVYRGTSTGTEVLVSGLGLPVPQPAPLTSTVTFTDTGAAQPIPSQTIVQIVEGQNSTTPPGMRLATITFAAPASIQGATAATITGNSFAGFNATFQLLHPVATPSVFVQVLTPQSIPIGTVGTGGSASFQQKPPSFDNTIQTALYLMPVGTAPVNYSDQNIVAFFPAAPNELGFPPSGASGGGGM